MSTIIVSTTADAGNGSLRGAIADANSGDTIQFSKQLSNEKITLKSGQFVLNKNLTIDGGNAPGLTISGNNASRIFYLDRKKTAVIKNLTIANGKTEGAGGAIDTRHESTITLENVNVNNNTSELGGGMRLGHLAKATIINSSFKGNDGTLSDKYKGFSAGAISHKESRGQLTIKGTTFEDNKGFNGGAILSLSTVSFVVEDSVFYNNTAENMEGGGAIFVDGVSSKGYDSGLANDGKILISGSRFEGNRAEGEGGALMLWGYTKNQGYKNDQAIIKDSVFVNNVVTRNEHAKGKGGAIWAKIGLDIRNVTFAENTARQQGGALWVESGLPTNIVNSTFSNNEALKDAGGAMFLNNRSTPINIVNSTIAYNKAGRANGALWFDSRHNVTLKNSIVAFNTAGDRRQSQVGYQPHDGGGNLEFVTSSKALKLFNRGLFADPLLNSLSSVNGALVHSLKSGSPAINAGISKGGPKTDQRGIQRDSQNDIGAFETKSSVAKLSNDKPAAEPIVKGVSIAGPTFSSEQGNHPRDNKKLVAYLTLNEGKGSRTRDRSSAGRRNDGELSGGAKWTDKGKEGSAIAFDGKNDLVKLKDSADINQEIYQERTISLWFRADETDISSNKQVIYEEGGSGRGLNIYLHEGELYAGAWNRDSKQSNWQGTWLQTGRDQAAKVKISAGKWHHVDLVLEGGSKVGQNALRGYIDGQKFGSGAGSQLWSHGGNIGIGSVNDGTRFHDGITPKSGSGFAGIIDEVMIFNDALSGSEVQSLI